MKKKIPLTILAEINEIVLEKKDYIIPIDKPGSILFLEDSDPKSDFHFEVLLHDSLTFFGRPMYYIIQKPSTLYDSSSHKGPANEKDVVEKLKRWLFVIEGYTKMHTVFDDPIQKKYEEDYYNDFRSTDPDAEYAPFDIPRLLLLEDHLVRIKNFVDENKQEINNEESTEKLKVDIDELIEALPNTPKNSVLKKLAKIYATISKYGMTVLKKFLKTFGGEVNKKIAQLSMEKLSDFISKHGDDIQSVADKLF